MSDPNIGTCSACNAENVIRCGGNHCPACHKSLTWEDCTTGTYDAANLRRLGYPEDEIRKMFPNADPERSPAI